MNKRALPHYKQRGAGCHCLQLAGLTLPLGLMFPVSRISLGFRAPWSCAVAAPQLLMWRFWNEYLHAPSLHLHYQFTWALPTTAMWPIRSIEAPATKKILWRLKTLSATKNEVRENSPRIFSRSAT